jgi:putative MATE family efflux protein
MGHSQTTYRGHVGAILTLGLPLIGGHLSQMAIGVTDTVMLGWYSVDALAAVTLGSTFFFIFFIFGSGFAWAVMPMVASFVAEGDETGIRRATRMGLWLSLGFAVLVMPFLIWSEPLLLALGQQPEVAVDAALYLGVAGWGIIPALLVMVLKSYLAALERTQIVLWITLVAAVANALANYALIFGNWGAPELGIVGAAIASLVTQVVSLIGVILYILIVVPQHQLFVRLWRADGSMLRDVFRLGWPIGLTSLSEVGLFAASAMMMGWLGKIPLAAHGIAVQLASITFMVHLGLSNVATIRAGNAWGRRDLDHMARGGADSDRYVHCFCGFDDHRVCCLARAADRTVHARRGTGQGGYSGGRCGPVDDRGPFSAGGRRAGGGPGVAARHSGHKCADVDCRLQLLGDRGAPVLCAGVCCGLGRCGCLAGALRRSGFYGRFAELAVLGSKVARHAAGDAARVTPLRGCAARHLFG